MNTTPQYPKHRKFSQPLKNGHNPFCFHYRADHLFGNYTCGRHTWRETLRIGYTHCPQGAYQACSHFTAIGLYTNFELPADEAFKK
jgi:hypothetical protein